MVVQSFSHGDSALLAMLLATGLLLLAVSQFVRIPYPIVLVLGGALIALVPHAPHVQLNPDLVLVAVLPPLLYGGAFFTSLRELRANVRAISFLAVGLVLVTMVAVAVAAHAFIAGLGWAEAFVLGAIVAPTDPTSSTAIAERLGLPTPLITLIEGESLVNDGTALVAYRFAVAAVVTGTFSLFDASWHFVLNVIGGIGVGLAVGYLIRQLRKRLDDPPVELAISLLSGYLGYLPAQALGVSGVLAAVTVGIYMGWHTPELTNVQSRLQGQAVWEIVFLLLNGFLFALVGLQLPSIIDALSGRSTGELIGYAALVSAVVIGARIAWLVGTYVIALVSRHARMDDPAPSWQAKAVVAWSGMRGAVSLAAALALPLTTDAGDGFPDRNLIIFLTFGVIFSTLVLQGLTLGPLIRALDLKDGGVAEHEEAKARIRAAEAALERLDELAGEDWVRKETAERMRGLYGFRQERFRSRYDPDGDGSLEEQSRSYQRLRRELLDAERMEVQNLRRQGVIGDDVMRRVVRDLDLEDARLDV
jgi:CPA1 family monovalent cation:H+ antiporter